MARATSTNFLSSTLSSCDTWLIRSVTDIESLVFILIIAYNKGHYNIIKYLINRVLILIHRLTIDFY